MIPQENGKSMTARDLAKLIGVSQSAISRAFTPGASISGELRERILSSARMLGYRPNAIASILSRRKSDIVALVISDLRNPYYPPLLEKLSRGLQQLGQQSLLFNITPGVDVKQQLMALRQYNVDALVIVSATILSGEELNLAAEGRRAVLVNRIAPDTTLTSVICDNAAGARAIADHFYELGHRRAAFVAGLPNTMVSRERQHSFIARLAELGMTLSACTGGGDYSYEAGYRSALEIARRGSTDAIFFANDILAIGGIDALREEAGLRVPDDISVAGFDDIPMAAWARYGLTTYRQPLDAIVATTLQLIAAPATPLADASRHHLLEGELVIRKSTAARGAESIIPPSGDRLVEKDDAGTRS